MPNPQIATRIPPEAVERLDRLAAALTSQALPGTAPSERSDAARVCVLAGLDVMEARLGLKGNPGKGSKRTASAKRASKRKARSLDPTPPNPHKMKRRVPAKGKPSPKRSGKGTPAALDPTPPDPHRGGST